MSVNEVVPRLKNFSPIIGAAGSATKYFKQL